MALRDLKSLSFWCALAACGTCCILSEAYVIRLVGVGVVLALSFLALPWLVKAYPFIRGHVKIFGREIDLERAGRRQVPPLLLASLMCAMAWPLLVGYMPRSQDHTVHLTRAWVFTHELLGQARLSGWSSYWFAGYPAGQLYPPGSDLWLVAFRLLHLGLTDWSVTYAHAFLAFLIAGPLALYWLGKRATSSQLVGFVAGLLWLIDAGAYREGGWNFTVYWGVWTQVLGLISVAASLAALDRLLEQPSARWAGAAAALVGFSLLCHPMSAVTLGIMIPSYLICRWALRSPASKRIVLAIGVVVWGGAISAWWLLPFLARSEWTIKVPELWRTMDQAAVGVVSGAPFQNNWPLIGLLAIVGAVRVARRRQPLALGLAIAVAVLLFVSTSTAFEQLRLEDISASFGRIIYQRLSMPAKLGWFVLAGAGVLTLVEGLKGVNGLVSPEKSTWRKYVLLALGGLVCAPFALHGVPVIAAEYGQGVGAFLIAPAEPDYPDYQRFLEWSRRQWDSRESFYRIAYLQSRNDHFMADAPVYNTTPAYKVGWTPCTTFRHRPESDDAALLRALSVRYVVSRNPVIGEHLLPETRFGQIRVYRMVDERMERFTLHGGGRAEQLKFDEEHIRVRVTGTSDNTRLTVHVANYADWNATLDGSGITPIRTVPIYGDRYPTFMQVDVPHDGVVELRFSRPPLRIVSQIVSALALIGVVFVLRKGWVRRLRPLWQRLDPALSWASRLIPTILVIVVVVFVVVYGFLLSRGSGVALGPLAYSFQDHVHLASGAVHVDGGEMPCRRRGEKLLCGSGGRRWVGAKQVTAGIVERSCIWAPPEQGKLSITFTSVLLGELVVGRHGLSDFAATQVPEGTPVNFQVTIEGGPTELFIAPNEVGWRPWEIDTSELAGERRDVTFEVWSDDDDRREYCFSGGVAPSSDHRN